MRETARLGGLAAFALLAAGCGGVTPGEPEPQVLNVYSWADYFAPETLSGFEERTGIKVVADTYDSNELLTTRLLTGGSGYDVVFPSGGGTHRLIQAGVLKPLDRSKLGNFRNLDPAILERVQGNDPGNRHAIPYLWGTTGIGYNPDLAERALGTRTIDSLAAVFDPAVASKLAGCGITWLDAAPDMFSLALIYLGRDQNSEDPRDLADAEALLLAARKYVRAINSDQYPNALASGDVCVSIGWSGPVQLARAAGAAAASAVEVRYVIPKEGAPLWCDMAAVPIDAPHSEAAYAFLDYLMEPGVIARVTDAARQANANAAATPLVDPAIRDDPTIYPDPATMARLRVDRALSPDTIRALERAWVRIKTSQ
jgi:putrescine transport system substrate-binding protein